MLLLACAVLAPHAPVGELNRGRGPLPPGGQVHLFLLHQRGPAANEARNAGRSAWGRSAWGRCASGQPARARRLELGREHRPT
jgi:hypothetical protein